VGGNNVGIDDGTNRRMIHTRARSSLKNREETLGPLSNKTLGKSCARSSSRHQERANSITASPWLKRIVRRTITGGEHKKNREQMTNKHAGAHNPHGAIDNARAISGSMQQKTSVGD
jgi:hypothetical protein